MRTVVESGPVIEMPATVDVPVVETEYDRVKREREKLLAGARGGAFAQITGRLVGQKNERCFVGMGNDLE